MEPATGAVDRCGFKPIRRRATRDVRLTAAFGDDADVIRDTDLQLLLLANTLGPMGSAILSPVLDSLIGPFGVSEASIGLVISVFTAPAIVMIPLVGVLTDRYGRKPILVAGLLLYGTAGTAIALTTDFRMVLALRFFQGIGFAGINPVIITAIGDLYRGDAEATAQGFRFTESGLTQVLFPMLSGTLIALAWYWPFLLYAIAFPIAFLVVLFFEEPMPAAKRTAAADGGDGSGSSLGDLVRLVKNRRVLAMVLARGFPVIAWIGFLTYNSILVVRVLGGTPVDAGLLVAAGSLTWAIAASQAGRLSAAFDSRATLLVVANAALGIGLLGFAYAPGLLVAGGGVALMGAGFGIVMSIYRSIITAMAPPALRGRLVSLGESFGRVTGTLTPVVMGGTIGLLSNTLGFATAVRTAAVGAGIVAGGVGIVLILVAATASPPGDQANPKGY